MYTSTASACAAPSGSATRAITVNALPSVAITPAATSTTPGTSVQLSAQVTNCNGCSYNWSNGQTGSTVWITAPANLNTDYYTCTVKNSAGCTASATAFVNGQQPFYSNQTWSNFGDGKTWSDNVTARPPGCTETTALTTANNSPQYIKAGTGNRYFYNWHCVNLYPDQLCPSGWHVPSADEFGALINATTLAKIIAAWGLSIGGVDAPANYYQGAEWWSSNVDPFGGSSGWALAYSSTHGPLMWGYEKYHARNVRCVK
jgi:hypothetical protein